MKKTKLVKLLLSLLLCGISAFQAQAAIPGTLNSKGPKSPDPNSLETLSEAKEILSFDFNELTPAVIGTVNAMHKHVTLTVPQGTNITALTPTITVSESATVSPVSGIAQDFTNPVIYTVTAEDGSAQEWTVTVSFEGTSSEKEILSFDFNELSPAVIGTINKMCHKVALTVPQGTNVTALVPSITISDFATISPVSGVAQDFTSPVIYTVTAQDGSTQEWTVTVSFEGISSEKEILSFDFNELSPAVIGTINKMCHKVALTVPQGTNVTALVPSITISDFATISPVSGVAQDFTSPVIYTVTAQDGSTQEWTVTVSFEGISSEKEILSFDFNELSPAVIGTINKMCHKVELTVPEGTDVTALVPSITISDFATISPVSGVAQDFTSPVIYTVTAQDGSTQEWTVTVTGASGSSEKDILTFDFNELSPAVIGTINKMCHKVELTVPEGTDVTALVPSITISDFATISPVSGVAQDFTSPVIYTVTAQDGTTQEWTVTVTGASGSSEKDILTFDFNELSPVVNGSVSAMGHMVKLIVPEGTDISALAPTITISEFATVSPASGVPQDFTSMVHYTVTAQDGSTQKWMVEVSMANGIREANEPIVNIFPNPAIDVINVNMNSFINKISVVNINGQMITESIINNNNGSINTSTIANGMYFLRIETPNGTTMNKIQILK